MPITAYKKKLYHFNPKNETQRQVEVRVSRQFNKTVYGDSDSIERGVRQLLADKVSGNLAGIWLLVAENIFAWGPGTYYADGQTGELNVSNRDWHFN